MRSVRGAVKRVGRNEIDPNAVETQTLAAITFGGLPDDPQRPTATAPAAASALDAIIQIIGLLQGAAVPK